jgi:predicted RNA-binding Zn-ribbon protein involved in translation (DUF1610 family)
MSNGFSLSREIIWHITCGQCGFYWTYPTMQTDEKLTDRKWHCPLCGKSGEAKEIADQVKYNED